MSDFMPSTDVKIDSAVGNQLLIDLNLKVEGTKPVN